jgi:hypothetical protein
MVWRNSGVAAMSSYATPRHVRRLPLDGTDFGDVGDLVLGGVAVSELAASRGGVAGAAASAGPACCCCKCGPTAWYASATSREIST